jgi:site-specific DNA-methyltransferase (adenine-specific)
MLTKIEMQAWWQPFWSDVKGASTRQGHPAPFPIELAERLIRMFSFAGDTVLDPFAGTCSTAVAAFRAGRNSVSNEIDPIYLESGLANIANEVGQGRLVGAVRGTVDQSPSPLIKKSNAARTKGGIQATGRIRGSV